MRLTTKGRYAVTAMLDIALHSGSLCGKQETVSVGDISRRQDISAKYLEQILGRLSRSELLDSHRGPGGGYVLAMPMDQISISAIISAVGEGVDATRCNGRADCQEGHMCLTHDLWANLSDQIDQFLQNISLLSLVEDQQHLRLNDGKPGAFKAQKSLISGLIASTRI